MKIRLTLILLVLCIGFAFLVPIGEASQGDFDRLKNENSWNYLHNDPIKIANNLLDLMEKAYYKEDVRVVTGLYSDPLVAFDVPRNMYDFFSEEALNAEFSQMFKYFSEVRCFFKDRQIKSEGNKIIVISTRYFGAKELPQVAKCLMVLVLEKPFTYSCNYVITNQTVIEEEYLPLEIMDNLMDKHQTEKKIPSKHSRWRRHFGG